MIDQAAELCSEWIYLAVLASWRALPVFLVVASLSLLLRRHVPARAVCVLWLLVIARFLLPVSIGSPIAIGPMLDQSLVALTTDSTATDPNVTQFETFTYQNEDGESITIAQLPPGATAEEQAAADAQVQRIVKADAAAGGTVVSEPPGMLANLIDRLEPLLIVLAWSVLLGLPALTIALLLRGVLSHVRFAWQLWRLPAITDRDTVDCLLRVCDDLRVGRRPAIKEVPSLHAPAMFGLFRTTICLPSSWRQDLNPDQLDWVFRHEVAHVKGRDGLVLFVANVARSLNCFNPLAWITFTKLQYHMERAADEAATRHLDGSQVRQYGELLIRFASGQTRARGHAAVGLLAMAAPNGLSKRIAALTHEQTNHPWAIRTALLPLVILIAIAGLTDAKRPEFATVSPRPIPNLEIALASAEVPAGRIYEGQPIPVHDEAKERMVSFNVKNAMAKARELEPDIDASEFVSHYFFGAYPITKEFQTKHAIENGVMKFRCTERREALIKQMLAAFERSGLWQIATEIRIIETDVRNLNQFDWSSPDDTTQVQRLLQGPPVVDSPEWDATFAFDFSRWPVVETGAASSRQPASVPVRAMRINRLRSEILIQQMQREPKSNLMQAPKVTMFNGQCASVSDITQRPFVTDVLEITGQKASSLQPRISVVDEGWRMLLKTTVTENEHVNLQLVLHHSNIDDVKLAAIPYNGEMQPDEQVTVQVPSVQTESIAVTSELGDDDALLVYSPKPYSSDDASSLERGKGQVFMIRTELIPDNAILKDFTQHSSSPSR